MIILRRLFVLLLLSLGLFAIGCDELVADANFHTWCGDQLCMWKLESGQIRKSPTWHRKDYGVELMDPEPGGKTVLSQIATANAGCIEFSTIADVAPEAQVTIGVDFNDDGTVDYEQPIAATGFREQKTQITAPSVFNGMRFVISKKGVGRAVLVQMLPKASHDCKAPPVQLRGLALGQACASTSGDECSSATCCRGLCAECCDAPEAAGVPAHVVACPGSGTCATVVDGIGVAFNHDTDVNRVGPSVPMQCDPGKGTHGAGAECLLDSDCASHVCNDEHWTVASFKDDVDCPEPPAKKGDCNVFAVHGGRCK